MISSCAPKSFLIVLINFLLVFSFFSSCHLFVSGTQAGEGQHAQHYELQFNFGERPFNIQQTPTGYRPIHQWLLAEQARLHVLRNPKISDELNHQSGANTKVIKTTDEDDDSRITWALERLAASDNLTLVSDILQLPQGTPQERAKGVAHLLGLD